MPCDRRATASGGRLPAASAAARRGTKPADEVLHPGAADQHGGVPNNRKRRNGGLTGRRSHWAFPSVEVRRHRDVLVDGRWRRCRRFCWGTSRRWSDECGHGRRRCESSVHAETTAGPACRRVPSARTPTCRFWSVPQWTKFSSWFRTGRVVRKRSRHTVIPRESLMGGRACFGSGNRWNSCVVRDRHSTCFT